MGLMSWKGLEWFGQTQAVAKRALTPNLLGLLYVKELKTNPKSGSMGPPRISDNFKDPISFIFFICGYNRPKFSESGTKFRPKMGS